jgi:hypothetical protein
LKVARESLAFVWDEALPLAAAHHKETGVLKDVPFTPSKIAYFETEGRGTLRFYSMRDDDRNLCGYGLYYVVPHAHYPTMLWALQDAVYVDPAYRGRASVRFMEWMDKQLALDGVQAISRQSCPQAPHGKLLLKMGYQKHCEAFVKRVS